MAISFCHQIRIVVRRRSSIFKTFLFPITLIRWNFLVSKRRRPASRRATLVRNPIFAEDEDYSISEYDTHLSIEPNKPKTLMQRFSNWIGGLGSRNKRTRRSDSETRPQIVVGPLTDRKVRPMFSNSAMDEYNNNHMHSSMISQQQPYEMKRRVITNRIKILYFFKI